MRNIQLNEADEGVLVALSGLMAGDVDEILSAIVSRAIRFEYLARCEIDLAAAVKPPEKKARKKSAEFVAPDWFDESTALAWDEYLVHRRKKGGALNPYGQDRAATKLFMLKGDGHDPVKVLRLAVTENWTGLFGRPDTMASTISGTRDRFKGAV